MVSAKFTLLARGFIGGAVVTASISYALLRNEQTSTQAKPSQTPAGNVAGANTPLV